MSQVWTTKRKGKKGTRYIVRWYEPETEIQRSKTFPRAKDAKAYKEQLKDDIYQNDYFAPINVSFEDWKQTHLEKLEMSEELRPKTIAGQREALTVLGTIASQSQRTKLRLK